MFIEMLHLFQRVEFIHETQAGFSFEYQNIHTRSIQDKYTVLQKAFQKRIVSIQSHLMVSVRTAKERMLELK